ncbi:uncharacterized protein LOC120753914 [Hirundo rustica]|uniref:uncharacterized protein LOC120753914 n=1 Tax=Hirundo rustica TaxID=43150 RepID=UPI001A94634D|nr:uncharacterized protein LOC120753914 [Hirundo rustica]
MEQSPWAGAVPGLHAGLRLPGAAGSGPGQGSRLCQARELARHRERLPCPARPLPACLPACLPIFVVAYFPVCLRPPLLFCRPPAAFPGCGRVHPKAAQFLKPVWASASSSVSTRALPAERWLRAGDVRRGRADTLTSHRAESQSEFVGQGRAGVGQTAQTWDSSARQGRAELCLLAKGLQRGPAPVEEGRSYTSASSPLLLVSLTAPLLRSLPQGMGKVRCFVI